MAKPELGAKRQCQSCATKFYDLNKDPIVCPKCGAIFQVAPTPRARRAPTGGRRRNREGGRRNRFARRGRGERDRRRGDRRRRRRGARRRCGRRHLPRRRRGRGRRRHRPDRRRYRKRRRELSAARSNSENPRAGGAGIFFLERLPFRSRSCEKFRRGHRSKSRRRRDERALKAPENAAERINH